MRRKRPPYARAIAERRALGSDPLDALVLAGADAWDMARIIGAKDARRNAIVVLPPPGDPDAFDWSFARGLRVRVWPTTWTPKDKLERLAVLLVYAGSPLVEVMGPDGSDCDTYKPVYAEE